MSITTTSVLPAPVRQSFSQKLLSTPTANNIHKIAAEYKQMPRNGGNTLVMRRYESLGDALVPLGNTGVTPPPKTPTVVDIKAEISFYGTYVLINEQVTLQNEDPVLNELSLRLGASLRETEDKLTRNMLASTASSLNCTAGINGDTPTELTQDDIENATRMLLSADGHMIMDSIEGEDRFGTAPIRNAYVAMCSTDLVKDLNNVDGFIQKNQYPSDMGTLRSEWGAVGNARFFISSNGSKDAGASNLGADVFNIFIVAMESYACIEQDGYSAKFLYRGPEYSDPLAMNASVGYKFAEVPKILNDDWVVKVRATLS